MNTSTDTRQIAEANAHNFEAELNSALRVVRTAAMKGRVSCTLVYREGSDISFTVMRKLQSLGYSVDPFEEFKRLVVQW